MEGYLNLEETKRYLIAWQENHDKMAANILIIYNSRLLNYLVHKYLVNDLNVYAGLTFDELLSSAMLGFLSAISNFDYHNYEMDQFGRYLSVSIVRAIKRDIKNTLRYKGGIDSFYIDDEETNLEEKIEDNTTLGPVETTEEKELKDTIYSILDTLSPEQKEVILLHYGFVGDKMSIREVAEKLNITAKVANYREELALRTLRKPKNSKKLKDFLKN